MHNHETWQPWTAVSSLLSWLSSVRCSTAKEYDGTGLFSIEKEIEVRLPKIRKKGRKKEKGKEAKEREREREKKRKKGGV